MSHHSLGGSDESDSGDNLPPLLSTSAPSSHPPILPTLNLSTVAPVSRLMMGDPSGNLSGQLPDGVEGGRRARLKKQIHMQRGKCLGELQVLRTCTCPHVYIRMLVDHDGQTRMHSGIAECTESTIDYLL